MAIFTDSEGKMRIDKEDVEPEYQCMAGINRGILYRRYLMAKHLGRPLERNEVVRLIDPKGAEADISNLKLSRVRSAGLRNVSIHKCDSCAKATAALCEWIGRDVKEGRTVTARQIKYSGKYMDNVYLVTDCEYYKAGPLPPIGAKAG